MIFPDSEFLKFLGDSKGANKKYKSPKTGLMIKPATYFEDYLDPKSSKYKKLLEKEKIQYAYGKDKKRFDPKSAFGRWLKLQGGFSSDKKLSARDVFGKIKSGVKHLFRDRKKETVDLLGDVLKKEYSNFKKMMRKPPESKVKEFAENMVKGNYKKFVLSGKQLVGVFKNKSIEKDLEFLQKNKSKELNPETKKKLDSVVRSYEKEIFKLQMSKGDNEKEIQKLEKRLRSLEKYPNTSKKLFDSMKKTAPPLYTSKEESQVGSSQLLKYGFKNILPQMTATLGISAKGVLGGGVLAKSMLAGLGIAGAGAGATVAVGVLAGMATGKILEISIKKALELKNRKKIDQDVVKAIDKLESVNKINKTFEKKFLKLVRNKKLTEEQKQEKIKELRKEYRKKIRSQDTAKKTLLKKKASSEEDVMETLFKIQHDTCFEAADRVLKKAKDEPESFLEDLKKEMEKIAGGKGFEKKAAKFKKEFGSEYTTDDFLTPQAESQVENEGSEKEKEDVISALKKREKKAFQRGSFLSGDLFVKFLGDPNGANIKFDSPRTGKKIKPSTYFGYVDSGEQKSQLEKYQKEFALDSDGDIDPKSKYIKWLGTTGVKIYTGEDLKKFLESLEESEEGQEEKSKKDLAGGEKRNFFQKIKGGISKKLSKGAKKRAQTQMSEKVQESYEDFKKNMKEPDETKKEALFRTMVVDELKRTLNMGKSAAGAFVNPSRRKTLDKAGMGDEKAKKKLLKTMQNEANRIMLKNVDSKKLHEIESQIEKIKKGEMTPDFVESLKNQVPPMLTTKEQGAVGKKYAAHYGQSTFLPAIMGSLGFSTKLAGSSALGKTIAGAAGAAALGPAGAAVGVVASLAVGSLFYKKLSKKMEKTEKYDNMAVAAMDGYQTMHTINKSYEKDLDKIVNSKDDENTKSKKIKEMKSRYNKDIQSYEKGRSSLSPRGKYAKKNQGFMSNILDMMHTAGFDASEEILSEAKENPEKFLNMLLEEMDKELQKKNIAANARSLKKMIEGDPHDFSRYLESPVSS